MPIKPENKARYPKDWKQISERIRFERAKNKCEFCGVDNYAVFIEIEGQRIYLKRKMITPTFPSQFYICPDGVGRLVGKGLFYHLKQVILTVAHLDHTPENCEDENLKALCQKCHNNYDRQHRNETRKANKKQYELNLE